MIFSTAQQDIHYDVEQAIITAGKDFYPSNYYSSPRNIKKLKKEWRVPKKILDDAIKMLNTHKVESKMYNLRCLVGKAGGNA